MKPQVDLFSFVFWRKLKALKRHFEINRPLDGFGFNFVIIAWQQLLIETTYFKIRKRIILMTKQTVILQSIHF